MYGTTSDGPVYTVEKSQKEKRERKRAAKSLFKEIMVENFQMLERRQTSRSRKHKILSKMKLKSPT